VEPHHEVTLSQVFSAYLAHLGPRAKASSVAQARVQAGTVLSYFGDDFRASDLTSQALDGFAEHRLRRVCPASLNGALGVLRSALRYAVETELLERMPARVQLLKAVRKEPRVLRSEQVSKLVAEAPEPLDAALLLAARCGLRHQEILHLQRRDIDLVEGTVHVSAKPGWCPKSHAERVVPMPARLALRMRRLLESLHDESPTAWLFPGYEGGPLVTAAPQIRKVFQAAGLYDPAMKPGLHMLRRTFASTVLGNGADVETVRQLGGWADLATVQRYVTSTDELKRAAVESLERGAS